MTFQRLTLTPKRIDIAQAYNYLTLARLTYARHVEFAVEFPAHDLYVSTKPEDYDDQIVFNKAARQILGLLAQVPRRQIPLITLVLSARPSREHLIPWAGERNSEEQKVFSGELRPTYLELSADWANHIPYLPEISIFQVELKSRALIFAPASIKLVASKMTRLKQAEWRLHHAEKMDNELRVRQRSAFAHTLKLLPMSLTRFKLEYIREPPRDGTFRPPGIVPPDLTGDILSRELRHFCQRDGLQDFVIGASVDSTILWPESQDPESNPPTWPTLSLLHIELNDVLPSGQWIEMRDPKADYDEFFSNFNDDNYRQSEIPGDKYERWFECIYNLTHFK